MAAPLHTHETLHAALARLFAELTTGADPKAGWVLNPGDPGLLSSLDRLSAAQASMVGPSGSSIAAHVDHLRYGLGLMIRWTEGEDPFANANYSESWKRTSVTEERWDALRRDFREVVGQWQRALATPRPLTEAELLGYAASVTHLAYHLGAIRQMNPALRGPRAKD